MGSNETDEFRRHTAELTGAWRRRGRAVATPAAAGLHHFNVLDALIDPKAPLHKAVMAAIKGRARA